MIQDTYPTQITMRTQQRWRERNIRGVGGEGQKRSIQCGWISIYRVQEISEQNMKRREQQIKNRKDKCLELTETINEATNHPTHTHTLKLRN